MGHDAEYPYIFRENADIYFNALAVYIQEFYGAVKVKMYVAGGSAIILRHNFRNSTEDWINSDFTQSPETNCQGLFHQNAKKECQKPFKLMTLF